MFKLDYIRNSCIRVLLKYMNSAVIVFSVLCELLEIFLRFMSTESHKDWKDAL